MVPAAAWAEQRVLAEVVIMRHGIRAPILPGVSTPPLTKRAWPRWPDSPGQLTRHGRDVVRIMGRYDGAAWRRAGLLPPGCPTSGAFDVVADTDQRTLDTARALLDAAFPRCAVPLASAADAAENPFRPVLSPDTVRLAREAAGAALEDFRPDRTVREVSRKLGKVLDNPGWQGLAGPGEMSRDGWPVVRGPLLAAFQVTDTFMMEYEQGMKPGWGRLAEADVERLLVLNTLYARLTRRPPGVSAPETATIRGMIGTVFARASARSRHVTLIVGHDDTLNALAGAFGLHWRAQGVPADMPLPAGGLVFDLLEDGTRQSVRIRYVAPTLGEARAPARLRRDGPRIVPLPCDGRKACTMAAFSALLRGR